MTAPVSILAGSAAMRKKPRRDARVAEGAPLLREYRVKSLIEGSNPSLSARLQKALIFQGFFVGKVLKPMISPMVQMMFVTGPIYLVDHRARALQRSDQK